MIKNTRFTFVTIVVICCVQISLTAQTIPHQLHISEIEHKYVIGGQAPNAFYAIDSIKKIELIFETDNWYEQMVFHYHHDVEIPATMIYDGDTLPFPVGVGFRGHSSYYFNESIKKSISISLDFADSTQKLFGYDNQNLNCGHTDPSFMRETLYENLIQKYIPSVSVNYAHVFLQGIDFGLYTNVQQLNKDFIKEWFYTNNGTTWRAERTDGAVDSMPGGVNGTGLSSFNYHGTESSDYSDYYTLKRTEKENPWQDLIDCISVLHNNGDSVIEDSINRYLDLDRTLWYLACEIIFSDEDSYVIKGGMDYFIYWEPETDRIVPLEYDGNSVMDPMRYNWNIFLKSSDSNFVLTDKLFDIPSIRQRYLAHVRTILDEVFNIETIEGKIIDYHNLIHVYVANDPVKLYSYVDYLLELDSLREFVVNRRNYILSNGEVKQIAPFITETKWISNNTDWGIVNSVEDLVINTKISGVLEKKVYLYYATGLFGAFTKVEMYDDGLHDDSVAGDNIYGAAIPAFEYGTHVRFYIESVAANVARTKRFDPPGAEHDVYYYKVNSDFVDVNSMTKNTVKIYPNPANNFIHIVGLTNENQFLEIYNITGQIILQQTINGNTQINIETFKPGLYFCKIEDIVLPFIVE